MGDIWGAKIVCVIFIFSVKTRRCHEDGRITGATCLRERSFTAEMVELIEEGVPSIACVQPFACLPNHVTGKGMIKELRNRYPDANISAIDYDPGSSEVNQLNRLKLLLANAPVGRHPDEKKV